MVATKTPLLAQSGGASAAAKEEAARALLLPICADKAARAKIVAQKMERGDEYDRATAKWDMDVVCEQIGLISTPVHDTADPSDDATHTNWIYDARWSDDGKVIASAGRDGTVRIWDVATGKSLIKIDVTKLPERLKSADVPAVRAVRFLAHGRSLLVAADRHPLRIFSTSTGEQVGEVPYAQADANTQMPPLIETTPSGLVIVGGYGGDLVVYDANAKTERYRLPGVIGDYPMFAVSEAGGVLATSAPGRTEGRDQSVFIQLRKLESGQLMWAVEAPGDPSAYAIAFSRNGARLVAAVRGQAYVYATGDGRPVNKVLVYPTFGSFAVALTVDGQRLITGQRHAQLWDIASGNRLLHFGPFSDVCHSVDISPDGKFLVTGHMGSDARIWEIETGKFFRRLGKNVSP